jgi:hypothetical protein
MNGPRTITLKLPDGPSAFLQWPFKAEASPSPRPSLTLRHSGQGGRTTQVQIGAQVGDIGFEGIGEAVQHEHDANDALTGYLLAMADALGQLARSMKREGWRRVKAADAKNAAGTKRLLAALEADMQNELARRLRAETVHIERCTGEDLIAHLASASEAGRGHGLSQIRGITVGLADEQDRIRAHRRAHGRKPAKP